MNHCKNTLITILEIENDMFYEALVKIGSVHAKHPRELSVVANEVLFKVELMRENRKKDNNSKINS